MMEAFKTWVVYRSAGSMIVNDMCDMCAGNMMIGGREHVIIGIRQIVPVVEVGSTIGYLIVLDMEAI